VRRLSEYEPILQNFVSSLTARTSSEAQRLIDVDATVRRSSEYETSTKFCRRGSYSLYCLLVWRLAVLCCVVLIERGRERERELCRVLEFLKMVNARVLLVGVELELALTSNPAKSSAAATGTLKVASTHICGKLTQTSSASALCPALALAPSLSRARALSHESSKRVSLSLTNERTNESSKRVSVIVFRIFGGTLLNDSDASSYTQAVLVP